MQPGTPYLPCQPAVGLAGKIEFWDLFCFPCNFFPRRTSAKPRAGKTGDVRLPKLVVLAWRPPLMESGKMHTLSRSRRSCRPPSGLTLLTEYFWHGLDRAHGLVRRPVGLPGRGHGAELAERERARVRGAVHGRAHTPRMCSDDSS